MNTYRVTCEPITDTEPGAFAGMQFPIEKEFVGNDADGNEIYEVRSMYDVTREFDLSPYVVKYEDIGE